MGRKRSAEHKKVEYIELVYDLVFVFLISRCDNLLTLEEDTGFFSAGNFEVYLFSTLVILQIWAFSTLYINRYGKNGPAEYLFLILNMFLLCFLAVETRRDWIATYAPYQAAWGLVIINLAVQYYRQLRRKKPGTREQQFLMRRLAVFCIQAAAIFLCIPIFRATRRSGVWIALAIGYLGPFFTRELDEDVPINMEHLAERVMLFVVLTFGETLISAAEYFNGVLRAERIYFAVCAFAIVIGMLLAYGFIYNKMLDRRRMGVGTFYMFLHVFIIVAINDVTVGLEFMQEPDSSDFLTLLFLVVSFFIYYAVLLFMAHHAGRYYLPAARTWIPFLVISGLFAAAAFFFVSDRRINAALSVVYPFAMFIAILRRRTDEKKENPTLPEEAL